MWRYEGSLYPQNELFTQAEFSHMHDYRSWVGGWPGVIWLQSENSREWNKLWTASFLSALKCTRQSFKEIMFDHWKSLCLNQMFLLEHFSVCLTVFMLLNFNYFQHVKWHQWVFPVAAYLLAYEKISQPLLTNLLSNLHSCFLQRKYTDLLEGQSVILIMSPEKYTVYIWSALLSPLEKQSRLCGQSTLEKSGQIH